MAALSTLAAPAPGFTLTTTGLNLTPTEQKKVRQFTKWLKEMKAEAQKGPFRLLDLPAELRNIIYFYTFVNQTPTRETFRNLAYHRMPILTRVSRQLRAESIPVFYAETSFYLIINTNIHDRWAKRTGNRSASAVSHASTAGQLRLKQPVLNAFRWAKDGAALKDVTLKIRRANRGCINENVSDYLILVTCHLKIMDGLQVSIVPGRDTDFGGSWRGFQVEQVDVDATLEEAKQAALSISAREGFCGFSLQDLRNICKKFQFERVG